MRRIHLTVIAMALATSACAGSGLFVAGDAALNPAAATPQVGVTVVAADDDGAVAGAEVTVDGGVVPPADDGVAYAEWNDEPMQVAVAAPGFVPAEVTVSEYPEETDGAYTVSLEPLVLTGTVVGPDGTALPGTTVTLNDRSAVTGDDGSFEVTRALPGDLTASRPAWNDAMSSWDGSTETIEIAMEPRDIKALRVSGDKAADDATWERLLQFADNSVVNAFVVDTKDENGWVFHDSEVETVAEIGALNENWLYDAEKIIADMEAHDLYKITRITVFQDDFLSHARPELAVRDETTGGVWENAKGLGWLDASDHDSWFYALELAEEACNLGFDEIQFDYIRFPSDGDISTVEVDGGYTEETRIASVKAFLEEAHDLLNPMGCAVAADIFAITLTSDWDEGIGQRPEVLSQSIDVLSPMIYTYTYGAGWGGIEDPNAVPVQIVDMALEGGEPLDQGFAIYRPWIQTWQLNAQEILSVQEVVESYGLGWMIWSANTQYDRSFLPDG